QNIRELIKGTEIKLGQIEKEAGCQPGYMSRLDKTENASDPTAEFIITAAQMLKVSVDVLLNVKIAELTPNERYIGSFLEKMIRDTIADKLTWNRETVNTLKSVSTDQNGNPQHPLFETVEYYEQNGYSDYPERMERVQFFSKAFEQETVIAGDCYNIRLKNGTLLFLMSVSKGEDALPFDDDVFATEVWMYQPGVPASCLCSTQNHKYIASLISDLYGAVAQNVKHPKVMKDYQQAINAFMNDDLSDDPPSTDELPF
ncbi:MAG: helix-turn-helix transcriptional regulator, partial [Oscillospiraceae bacterium]|nr:helix-turn-helix transcriptional regulator [Oscillospiraceae bacterium]